MRFLLGPELLWLLFYGAANLVAKVNVPPSKAVEDFIDKSWFYVPMLVLLCFALWWVPMVEKNWLLLRVWVFSIIGGHYVLEKILSAHSTQGPGTGTAWIVGMMFLLVVLFFGSIFIKIKF
ncbi:MAG: hypothetical protein R2825_20510 [Saprospiraceae bacterium]